MSEQAQPWINTTSPRDQDEEFEGEGDLPPREVDPAQAETKYWKIQAISGANKPKWRNCHTAVVQDDNKMIVFGGMHRKSKLNDCYSCDLEKNEWTEIRAHNPPSARYCHTATLFKNQFMLVFGGLGDRGQRFNDLCVLDLNLQEWSQPVTAGTPPEPRSHHGAVLYGDRLIIFGGLSGLSAERLNTLHILDLEKRPWTWSHPQTIGIPPTGRLYPTLSIWKNQLSVFAGYTGKLRLNDIHFLDLSSMVWSEPWTRDDRPNPVYGHSGTQLGSKLLVFGGNTGVSYYENHVYMLDFETMLWKRLNEVDCPSGRRYHTAVLSTSTQKLFVYGGSTVAKAPEDFLYVLDTTLIPGLEEWTFDEAHDIIHQGIRALTRTLSHTSSSSSSSSSSSASPALIASSSSAIDISVKKEKKTSSTSTTSASPSSINTNLRDSSSGPLSSRKRKKSRGESEESRAIVSARDSGDSNGSRSASLGALSVLPVEEQAGEALRLLKLHFKRLKREKEELRMVMEDFQEQQKRFEAMTSHMGKYVSQHGEGQVVKLNVGGVHFQTTTVTLTSNPDSMLSAMFSGRYKLPTDEKGRIFIDRDGTHFRYILNFLRDGTLNVPSDNILLMDILQEAQFYQLHKLVQLVKLLLKDTIKPVAAPSATRHRITPAQRALSISELRDNPPVPRTGTSPDFDDYWANL